MFKVGDIVKQQWFQNGTIFDPHTYDDALFEVIDIVPRHPDFIDFALETNPKWQFFLLKPLNNLGRQFLTEIGFNGFRSAHLKHANGLEKAKYRV